ncbi:AraC family transcriptional regulator [Chryseobacterium sp. JV558]|uniref:AraC family transcriptional regulator n=1 Tax=Chryseobacterium sp. JV558 TaxID=2663236 RepID=UPI00299EF8DE|nr:AraC family transcriptional regulator [Chryseobacterium sp. JV558]MDW9379404.1 helix-turn-helix domain-containing protein [Chryseobacterium sp. JV558]
MEKPYPTFDICHLITHKLSNDLFNADRFEGYLAKNPPIKNIHKHNFYHLVYFTSGTGNHTIDFTNYPIEAGSIYFMSPGQVHHWDFETDVQGYVINFSGIFFDQLFLSSSILDQFAFFNVFSRCQMLKINETNRSKVIDIFENILGELANDDQYIPLMIASKMLQLFIIVSRELQMEIPVLGTTHHNSIILKQFFSLIEDNFKDLRLPKDYAALLYITSNHLNFLCKEHLNISSGEIIRNRILLEAKRMLVNYNVSVANIALELNFFDTSYFIKFFKKYTRLTPEAFRKQHYTA